MHPLSNPAYNGASILIVNANFGCGSSREHAPQAIRRRGFRAIVGESFSEIFFGNSVALGMPCVIATPETVSRLMALIEQSPDAVITVDLKTMHVSGAGQSWAISLSTAARSLLAEKNWTR